jgi:hypothetical protein
MRKLYAVSLHSDRKTGVAGGNGGSWTIAVALAEAVQPEGFVTVTL